MPPATIYLDNAATSFPKPPGVAEAMVRFMTDVGASPGRASYHAATEAGRIIDAARLALTRLLDGDDPQRLIFTLNCTDALNIAIKGCVRPGDHVITTVLEHNSVSRPLQAMADAGTITLTRVGASADGFIDPADIAAAWTPNTRLVAVLHASNVLGTIQPIADVGAIVRECGGLFLVDAAQTAGVEPISVREMMIDLLAAPGHKSLFGPTGTGLLYVGERADLTPWREGGTGTDSATPTQPTEFPAWLEAGTANTVGTAGLLAGVEYVNERGIDAIAAHERGLLEKLIGALAEDERFTIYGPRETDRRIGAFSFTVDGLDTADAGAILDTSYNIAVRTGLLCAPHAHRLVGTFPDGTIRISPGAFNTPEDIDAVIDALFSVIE